MILWASGVLTLHSLTGVVVGWIIVGVCFTFFKHTFDRDSHTLLLIVACLLVSPGTFQ